MAADPTGLVQLWDLHSHRQLFITEDKNALTWSRVAFSPDGARFTSIAADPNHIKFRVWETSSLNQLGSKVLRMPDYVKIMSSKFTSDGRRFVLVVQASFRKIPLRLLTFDGETAELLTNKDLPDTTDRDAPIVNRSGTRVLILPYDGDLNKGRQLPSLWNTEDGSRIALLGRENDLVKAAEFTPDGSLVATVLADGSVHTWNGELGALNWSFGKVSGAPISIAFSNNGRYLALLTEEVKIHVFNLLSGDVAPPVPLDGNPGRSISFEEKAKFVAVSDDARRFATASSVAAHVWDHRSEFTSPDATDKLVQVTEIPRQNSGSSPPIFSPNGQLLLMASDSDLDGNAWFRMYSSIEDLTNLAKSALPRCLTLNERSGFFLDPEPPAWCIEMEKWPYQNAAWKQWLAETRLGMHPPLPSGP